ncbi:uncharacterized protein [Solanum tuberosum]|uniref:uncharacterized protein isoform X5 n=1 Tax=Solanum tuberosum TaxID=4113 RepID=UPI000739FB41|nr:PREDICTED: uncharacterized protein LOC102592079 isoform X5 [Solanum tuberosum]
MNPQQTRNRPGNATEFYKLFATSLTPCVLDRVCILGGGFQTTKVSSFGYWIYTICSTSIPKGFVETMNNERWRA